MVGYNKAYAYPTRKESNIMGSNNQFSLVMEGQSTTIDGEASIITGTVCGTVAIGDEAFIYMPDGNHTTCEITGIEASIDGKTKLVEEATDTQVNLQLDMAATLPAWSVFTTEEQVGNPTDGVLPTNPALAGLIKILPQHSRDNTFHAVLSYWTAHAKFLTLVQVNGQVESHEGMVTMKKGTTLGFRMLSTKIKIDPEKDPQDCFVLPLFTNNERVEAWKNANEENKKLATQVLSFQDVINIIKGNGSQFSGIVINPFDKTPCTLPMKYIDTIIGTKGYQAEFGKAPAVGDTNHGGAAPEPSKQQRVLIGVPKESDESKGIREALAAYGQSHDEVRSISLMVKIEEATKKMRYLILLDLGQEKPDNAAAKPHMDGIFKAIRPFCKEVVEVEFALRGQIPQVDAVADKTAEKMLVYSVTKVTV